MDAIDIFHSHLNICDQCREHPFDLCTVGGPLLVKAAGTAKVVDAYEHIINNILGKTPMS